VVGVGTALLVLGVGSVAMAVAGANPLEVYARLVSRTLLTPYGIGQTLWKATPLLFTGLAVAVPLRAGLFNIGAEGQLHLGAFAAAWLGLVLSGVPGPLLAVGCGVAAFAAGGLWGGIAGALKARFGAHEVITTIMLNFLAAALTGYLTTYHLAVPETIHTAPIPEGAWLTRLSTWIPALHGASVSTALFVALLAALGVGILLWRTVWGYELRAVGLGARAAEANGIPVGRTQLLALVVGGGLAGLVGVHEVLGYRHWFSVGFSDGVGFVGIAVAMLGFAHPLGVVLAALLFGAMSHGGLAIADLVPREVVGILQGVTILAVLTGRYADERWRLALEKARVARGEGVT
jgi:simple sugar transport system permease protein